MGGWVGGVPVVSRQNRRRGEEDREDRVQTVADGEAAAGSYEHEALAVGDADEATHST